MDSRTHKQFKWTIPMVVGAVIAAAALYFFAPTQYPFYPRCLVHSLTGLSCPGCGSLRALHHLLHGDMEAAFRFNPLLVVLLPVMAGACLSQIYQRQTGANLFPIFKRPFWIWLLLGLIIAFTIVRNLPFGPLARFRL